MCELFQNHFPPPKIKTEKAIWPREVTVVLNNDETYQVTIYENGNRTKIMPQY